MPEFNEVYILKQNATDMRMAYISIKQDWGINVIFPKNENNWNQYFFYVSGQWEMSDSDARLIRRYSLTPTL